MKQVSIELPPGVRMCMVPVRELIETMRPEKLSDFLGSFRCTRNLDIQGFITNPDRMLSFERQGITCSCLLVGATGRDVQIAGYFTLTNKALSMEKAGLTDLSKTFRRKIEKFRTHEQMESSSRAAILSACPLIAQLGRNDVYEKPFPPVDGSMLLDTALELVSRDQRIIGGRFVYVECENKTALLEFYSRHQFHVFGNRKHDEDADDGSTLTLLIRRLKPVSV